MKKMGFLIKIGGGFVYKKKEKIAKVPPDLASLL